MRIICKIYEKSIRIIILFVTDVERLDVLVDI